MEFTEEQFDRFREDLNNAERVNWVLNRERYDLHPNHYNQTFEDEGDWFQIVGLDTSKKTLSHSCFAYENRGYYKIQS